jgi:hypothetical protein
LLTTNSLIVSVFFNNKAGSDFCNAGLTKISVEGRLEGTEKATFFFVLSYFLFRLGPGDG